MSNPLSEQFSRSLSQIQEKHPLLPICGAILVILLVDYVAVLQFQLKAFMSLNPKISTLSQDLKGIKDNIARMPQYEKEVKTLTEKIEKISKKVKPKGEMPLIIEDLSRVANKNGVKIDQIMPDPSAEKLLLKNKDGSYYSTPVLIEARSGYHNFGRFLNQLEIEGLFMDTPELAIMSDPAGPTEHKMKLTLNVIFFENAK